jgi:hypothetical protein
VISSFKPYLKYLTFLGFLLISIIVIGFIIINALNTYLVFKEFVILTLVFAVISLIVLIIFFIGQTKEPGTELVFTFASIGLKFILEAVIALLWFVVAKNLLTQYVLLFFILYLAFTFFSTAVILNVLNNKGL